MIETFFSVFFSTFLFAVDVVFRGLIWFVGFVILLLVVLGAYWLTIKPLTCALEAVHPKYERVKAVYRFLKDTEEWYGAVLIILAVITFPLFVMSPSSVGDEIDRQITAHRNHEVVDYSELRQYKLVDITNPTHVYATIQDVKSGNMYRNYVSKYCNGTNRLGDKHNIEVTIYHMSENPDEKLIKFHGLERAFCS